MGAEKHVEGTYWAAVVVEDGTARGSFTDNCRNTQANFAGSVQKMAMGNHC